MDEVWHSISYKEKPSGSEILAEARAGTGSPWYSGHFPDDPILPGIAILSMVTDAITHHESEKGKKIRIVGIRRVRFRLPVRPNELLKISLSSSHQDGRLSYHFDVAVNGKPACTGVIVAELLPEESEKHG
jgi:3-hydroxyacyl-[acyl-carrier-protein] dehydratase